MQLRITEVMEVKPNEAINALPGTVLFLDPSGLFVAVSGGRILRIDVVYMDDGFFSGSALYYLGIQTGDHFDSAPLLKQKQ